MSFDQGPLPGTYRTADRTRVDLSDALAAWTPLAYDELLATAREYGKVTTYLQLSEYVQEMSGIRTRVLLTHWIGRLLEAVAVRAKADGQPPLTALCVRQDGTIGEGYARAPKSIVDLPKADIEMSAAEHRLRCYRMYAVDLPADGGSPALTKAVADRRRSAAVEAKAHVPRPVCTSCFTELPETGQCDFCA